MMDISDNIISTFELINYENYWRRACYEKFKSAEVILHGQSWKQCFSENYIQELITNFKLEDGEHYII
jgi:hypothetical protein